MGLGLPEDWLQEAPQEELCLRGPVLDCLDLRGARVHPQNGGGRLVPDYDPVAALAVYNSIFPNAERSGTWKI